MKLEIIPENNSYHKSYIPNCRDGGERVNGNNSSSMNIKNDIPATIKFDTNEKIFNSPVFVYDVQNSYHVQYNPAGTINSDVDNNYNDYYFYEKSGVDKIYQLKQSCDSFPQTDSKNDGLPNKAKEEGEWTLSSTTPQNGYSRDAISDLKTFLDNIGGQGEKFITYVNKKYQPNTIYHTTNFYPNSSYNHCVINSFLYTRFHQYCINHS